MTQDSVNRSIVSRKLLKLNEKIIDILVNNNIATSRREAREMLASNAISLNNEKYTDENAVITKDIAIEGKVIVIRKGKKKQYIGMFE